MILYMLNSTNRFHYIGKFDCKITKRRNKSNNQFLVTTYYETRAIYNITKKKYSSSFK